MVVAHQCAFLNRRTHKHTTLSSENQIFQCESFSGDVCAASNWTSVGEVTFTEKRPIFSFFLQSADKILHYWCTLRDCHRLPRPSTPPDGPLTVIYELMHADFDFSWHTPSCSGDWQPTKELLSGSAAGTYKNKTAARGAAVTHCTPRRDVDLRWRRCCICTCLVRFCSLGRICCSLLPKETKPETPSVRNAASKERASRQWKQTKSHKNLTNYAHCAIFSTTVSIFNGLSVCPHLITEHEPRLTTEKKEKKQPPCKLEQGCHWHFQCTNSGQLQIPAKPRIIWWLVGRSGVLKSGRCIQLPQPVPW